MSQLKMNVFRRRNTFVTVGLFARFNRLLPSFIPLVAHLKHVQTQREIMCSGLAPATVVSAPQWPPTAQMTVYLATLH